MPILEHVALGPLTTLGVGGSARYFVEAVSLAEVEQAVAFARLRSLPLFVLGGGSNLVISDDGWQGLVLKVAILGVEDRPHDGFVSFEVGAGEQWDTFVAHAVAHDCAGLECLSGIPGSVGGTPVQNVGAYGQEVSDTIQSVVVFDLRDNQVRELCSEACGFEYRSSIFNTTERGRFIILRVTFALSPHGKPHIEYAELTKYFAAKAAPPTLAETRAAIREIRSTKAMLIQPGDEDSRSAGSFFKNPIVSSEQYLDLAERAKRQGLAIPSYPATEARRKISAAWLVEHSGFYKGYSTGGVGISRKHALAIINRGGATAAEIIVLKETIQRKVEELWGLHLDPEPVFVGFK